MAGEPTLELVARDLCCSLNYTYDGYIDSGRYKETYCIHDNEQKYALKVFKPDSTSARTQREIDVMHRLNNPNIVKLFNIGTFDFNGLKYLFFLEEFLSGGSLGKAIETGNISKGQLKSIALDITYALADLNKAGIVHRDIKPDNIMFNGAEKRAVLVDFGLVRLLSEVSLTQSFFARGPCTPIFASPEQLNNNKELIDWRSDQFSLAVTLYYSFYKTLPFADDIVEHVESVARYSKLPGEVKGRIKEDGLEPLTRMLSRYPVERYATPIMLTDALERLVF